MTPLSYIDIYILAFQLRGFLKEQKAALWPLDHGRNIIMTTKYEVAITTTDGKSFVLRKVFRETSMIMRLMQRAADRNQFLAVNATDGPAYVNSRFVVSFCYYETGA